MANTEVHSGYLLHSRPYRDTSLICEFFLQHLGRVSIIYKGVKKAGKAGAKARLLQPFSPLSVSFHGRSDLKTGILLESDSLSKTGSGPVFLQGKRLYSGLYLNELLLRLLYREEPHDELFLHYTAALQGLTQDTFEQALRVFEHQLLAEMGYELVLNVDVVGDSLEPNIWYRYEFDQGLIPLPSLPREARLQSHCFLGQHLLAIQQHLYEDADCLKAAKRLSRLALAPHLGDKPLKSRELFKQLSEY